SDSATTRVITNFGPITIGFKEAWISSFWTMPPTTSSTMLRLPGLNLRAMKLMQTYEALSSACMTLCPTAHQRAHGMNESAQMERSGRRVYQDLLAFRSKTKKYVYVLASHSHFLIEDVYNV